jgi:ketosteroid isomerase-like protein
MEPTAETQGVSGMSNLKYAAYEPAAPYFNLVRGALGDLVDGEHFFDIVTDDVVYEVLYDFPGWPRVIQGQAALMTRFRFYVDNIALQSADKLTLHKTDDGRVVVIEYEVHGTNNSPTASRRTWRHSRSYFRMPTITSSKVSSGWRRTTRCRSRSTWR